VAKSTPSCRKSKPIETGENNQSLFLGKTIQKQKTMFTFVANIMIGIIPQSRSISLSTLKEKYYHWNKLERHML